MTMSALIDMMKMTMEVHGDMEVTVMDTKKKEIAFVEGFSFDTDGESILLETMSFSTKKKKTRLIEIRLELEKLQAEKERLEEFFLAPDDDDDEWEEDC